MKLKKLFKIIIMTSTTAIPLTSASVILSSCGHKNNKKSSFADFTKAAKAESSINIIKNATKQASGWNNLVASDLTKDFISATNNKVIFNISSASKNQVAEFSAAYTTDQAYKVSDWTCSSQPKKIWTFADFTKLAKAETATNIVKNAKVKAKGWDALPKGDLSKRFISATNNQVIFDISSKSKIEIATFSAIYIKNLAYQVSDWTCASQPFYDWEAYTTMLLEDKAPGQDKNDYNGNMIKKILDILDHKPESINPNINKFLDKYDYPVDSLNVFVDPNSLTYTPRGGSKKLGQITFQLSFYLISDKTPKLLTTGGLFAVSKEFAGDEPDPTFDSMKILKDIN